MKITEVQPLIFTELSPVQLMELAHEDGFESMWEMIEYFEKRYGPDFWTMDFEINRFKKRNDAERIKELDSQGLLKGIMTARSIPYFYGGTL